MALLVVPMLLVPTTTSLAGPARATSGSWLEAAGLGWLPDFLRQQTGLDLDWEWLLSGHSGSRPPGADPVTSSPQPTTDQSSSPEPSSTSVEPPSAPAVTPTDVPSPVATVTVVPTEGTPTVTVTPTEAPTPTMTDAPTDLPTSTPTEAPTAVPVPTVSAEPPPTTAAPEPSMTSAPPVEPTSTPVPAPGPTATPVPTITVTPPAPTTEPAVTHPLLIKHGWDIPSPSFVQSHVASMEQMPFDGLTIAMPGLSNQVQRQTPVSYDQFQASLAPVAATRFTTLKHNFVMVYATPGGDYFGDWSVPVANFANLAKAARDAGFEGIAYDNEEYFGRSVDYPAGCPDHTLAECQDQVRLRGQQVMDAMRAQWPTVRTLATFGPWVSEPATYQRLSPVLPYNDVSFANELEGSFVVGMTASTVGTPAEVIDGGEIYTARSASQFAAVHDWQKNGMPATSGLIPGQLKASWAGTISAAFGVYDEPWIGVPMDVGQWQTTLTNALAGTDEYVWAYTERYDWWGTGWPSTPVPSAWVDATRNARLAAG